MDYLRDGIHLRAMAQKDPLVEYRGEGHTMFEELGVTIREEVVLTLFHAQIEVTSASPSRSRNGATCSTSTTPAGADAIAAAGAGQRVGRRRAQTALHGPPRPRSTSTRNVGRNDPCWCGSGKKFKKCHGA